MPTPRSAPWLAVSLWFVLGCSPTGGNVNGTLRPNQRLVLEGRLWQDERCGTGANFANCCRAWDALCPDFADYSLDDVRVDGQRVVALFHAQDSLVVAISDDAGETWRTVTPGSVGNLAGYFQASLYLYRGRVILMIDREVPRPFGNVFFGQPFELDLSTGAATAIGDASFLSRTPATIEPDGTWVGVSFGPEDQRGGTTCVARVERWKPGQGRQPATTTALFQYPCVGSVVSGADDGNHFGRLFEQPNVNACFVRYEASSNSASATCLPWAQWPAKAEPFIAAAYAGERSERLRAWEADGKAYVTSPFLSAPVLLGDGAPVRTQSPGGRSRFAGMIPVRGADGSARVVRVTQALDVEAVPLPTSPCEGAPATCFDPQNADIANPGVGDVHWVEPLGNGEFLVFYNHDLAPGINQVKQHFTVSRERLGGGTDAGAPAVPGYPRAAPAGEIGKYCAKKLSCDPALEPATGMAQCLDRISGRMGPGVETILQIAAQNGCSALFDQPGAEACILEGGVQDQVSDGGIECVVQAGVTRNECGWCFGDVAIVCTPDAIVPTNCAAQGLKCGGTSCRNDCVAASPFTCFSGKGQGCLQGAPAIARCDQLGMSCVETSTASGAAAFCVSDADPSAALGDGPPAPVCVGTTLVWGYRGAQYVDCLSIGFLGCANGRCTP